MGFVIWTISCVGATTNVLAWRGGSRNVPLWLFSKYLNLIQNVSKFQTAFDFFLNLENLERREIGLWPQSARTFSASNSVYGGGFIGSPCKTVDSSDDVAIYDPGGEPSGRLHSSAWTSTNFAAETLSHLVVQAPSQPTASCPPLLTLPAIHAISPLLVQFIVTNVCFIFCTHYVNCIFYSVCFELISVHVLLCIKISRESATISQFLR